MPETSPLRIAIFSDSAFPILNGVSVSVDTLINELRNQGHSVHLYATSYPGKRDTDPNTFRFPAMEFPFWRGYPLLIPPVYPMLSRFRKHTYDVIHTHTPFLVGMVGLRWAESHEIPIVSTYHTLYDRYAHYVKMLPRRYVRFRIAKHTNFYYNRVNHVITPTDISKKWLLRHSVTSDVSIIPTGSPPPPALNRASVRAELGVPPGHRILLYVGRLAREKNLEVLIEAACMAMKHDPAVQLWMVGDGPYRSECLEQIRQLGIGDRTRLVGFVPRAEVDRYYAAADLFLFTSISETQGLVVQEAMQLGLPAVVASGGGAGEAVRHLENGMLVKNDVKELAEAVQAVLGDPVQYARLSANARRTGLAAGVAPMASAVTSVYRRVVASYANQMAGNK